MVKKVQDDADGAKCRYSAWKALKDWYLDPTQKDRMIAHWETKLEENVLDNDTTATAYINNFEMYVRKLKLLNETWDEDKRVREFKKRVEDPDYDMEIRVHKGSFDDMISEIRIREQELDRVARESSKKNKRTRRVVFENDGSSDENDSSKKEKNI